MIDGDPESNLLCERFPSLFKELRPEDNKGVDLRKITVGSGKKLNWRCLSHNSCDGHFWTAKVCDRTGRGSGCPFCCKNGAHQKFCKCTQLTSMNAIGGESLQPAEKTKRCGKSSCKKEKPVSDFASTKSRKDGLSSYCKECVNESVGVKFAIKRLLLQGKCCQD